MKRHDAQSIFAGAVERPWFEEGSFSLKKKLCGPSFILLRLL
jgi:hypothetical protein